MKLSKNEKLVLKYLLDNGRVSDVDMAKKMHISTQAVGQIRKKLEDNKVISGYNCDLNFEKLGLNQFALIKVRLKEGFRNRSSYSDTVSFLRNSSESIFSFLHTGNEASYLSVVAFRDQNEMERFFNLLEFQYFNQVELVKVYPFSHLNFLKNSSKELFNLVLNDQPIIPRLTID
jgi:Lrp/AsnC family transcriptional regulator, leucine-responsive regulatory protein